MRNRGRRNLTLSVYILVEVVTIQGIPTCFIFDGDSNSSKKDDTKKVMRYCLGLRVLRAVDEKVYLSVCESVANELATINRLWY